MINYLVLLQGIIVEKRDVEAVTDNIMPPLSPQPDPDQEYLIYHSKKPLPTWSSSKGATAPARPTWSTPSRKRLGGVLSRIPLIATVSSPIWTLP